MAERLGDGFDRRHGDEPAHDELTLAMDFVSGEVERKLEQLRSSRQKMVDPAIEPDRYIEQQLDGLMSAARISWLENLAKHVTELVESQDESICINLDRPSFALSENYLINNGLLSYREQTGAAMEAGGRLGVDDYLCIVSPQKDGCAKDEENLYPVAWRRDLVDLVYGSATTGVKAFHVFKPTVIPVIKLCNIYHENENIPLRVMLLDTTSKYPA